MRLRSGLGISVLAFWCVLAWAPVSHALTLKLNWKKGQMFRIYWLTEQKIDQVAMGRQSKVEQTIGTGYSFETKAVDGNGVADVLVTFERIYFKVRTAGRLFLYDSQKPPKRVPAIAAGFAALLKRGFSMKVTPLGEVRAIKGVDKMLNTVIGSLRVKSPAQRAQLGRQLKQQFGNNALRQMMEQMMAIYPDKPVKKGDTWKKTLRMGGAVPMVLKRSWTLVAVRGGFAFLKATAKILPNKSGKPLSMGPLKLRYKLQGTQTGTMFVQLKSGFPMRGRGKQFLKGKINVKGNIPNMPKNMTWPVKIDTVIQFKPFKK